MIYEAINQAVLDRVPVSARRILDLGCGSGALDERLKSRQPCHIVGVTYSQNEGDLASHRLDEVQVRDLNTFDPAGIGQFDCVICSHVLEHLYNPQALLKRLRPAIAENGRLVIALPNILLWRQRLRFLRGHFRYTDGGVMDSTHFRFFDWQTAFELISDAGYRVTMRDSDGHFPMPGVRRVIGPLAHAIDSCAVRVSPGLFAEQFIFVATL